MCFTRKKHYQKKYIKVKSSKVYPEPNVLQNKQIKKQKSDKKE